MDIYGQALTDFYNDKFTGSLWINTSYGDPEEMPVEVFFRDEDEMPEMEILAMKHCKGNILDIGAGAGSHSLWLQSKKQNITALEISTLACQLMQKRGVQKVINEDIFNFSQQRFDTLLLLMNGIGLTGSLTGLKAFLDHAHNLLNASGSIIFDSSDISYLYTEGLEKPEGYFGEVSFQYEYRGIKDEWFHWLYVDQTVMKKLAKETGWNFTLLFEDDNDQYLGELSRI